MAFTFRQNADGTFTRVQPKASSTKTEKSSKSLSGSLSASQSTNKSKVTANKSKSLGVSQDVKVQYNWGKRTTGKAARVDAAVMAGINKDFVLNMIEMRAKSVEAFRRIPMAIALQAYAAILRKTPVDTGRARGNWFVSAARPKVDTFTVENTTPVSSQPALAASALADYKAGDPIFITNSLPYIRRLEYGWSDQAPHGMVRPTIAELNQIFGQAAKDVKDSVK